MSLPAPPTLPFDEQVAALRGGAGARALPDAVIRVSGGERVDWLAGMVTNDTKSLRAGEARYAAVVHVKGKILSDAWVYARAGDLLLAVHPRAVDAVLAHLEQHVIMEDVELEVARGATVVSVQGPRAAELVGGAPGAFPADRLGRGGVDFVVLEGEGPHVPPAAPGVSEEAWEAARLEAGVPRFGVDFDEQNYVQEANITARAVSFNKGCYVGQEVVCRLEMRGHVRRQLVALVVDGDEPPPAGAQVVRDGADVGAVTSAARSPATGRGVALAMVKWDVASAGGEVTVQGHPARIVPRPVA